MPRAAFDPGNIEIGGNGITGTGLASRRFGIEGGHIDTVVILPATQFDDTGFETFDGQVASDVGQGDEHQLKLGDTFGLHIGFLQRT